MRKTKTSLTPSEQPSHCQDLVDVDKEIRHGSILGGSLKRSLGTAKLAKRRNHPPLGEAATPYAATNNVTRNLTYLNHAGNPWSH